MFLYLAPAGPGTGKTPPPEKGAFVKICRDMILTNQMWLSPLFEQSGVDNHVPCAHIKRCMIATDAAMRDRLFALDIF